MLEAKRGLLNYKAGVRQGPESEAVRFVVPEGRQHERPAARTHVSSNEENIQQSNFVSLRKVACLPRRYRRGKTPRLDTPGSKAQPASKHLAQNSCSKADEQNITEPVNVQALTVQVKVDGVRPFQTYNSLSGAWARRKSLGPWQPLKRPCNRPDITTLHLFPWDRYRRLS